uniref:CRC domain-containing protein n=1 Tax=Leersia perrieri TaxID=77586 RepID=A0A0D9WKF0_9ORYZ
MNRNRRRRLMAVSSFILGAKNYCPCFSTYHFCVDCKCSGCHNTEDNGDEVEETFAIARMKNPGAFGPKIVSVQDATIVDPRSSSGAVSDPKNSSGAVPGNEQLMYAKGCICRKSKCSKNYCECYKNKVGCTSKCKCQECGNQHGIKNSEYTTS